MYMIYYIHIYIYVFINQSSYLSGHMLPATFSHVGQVQPTGYPRHAPAQGELPQAFLSGNVSNVAVIDSRCINPS